MDISTEKQWYSGIIDIQDIALKYTMEKLERTLKHRQMLKTSIAMQYK